MEKRWQKRLAEKLIFIEEWTSPKPSESTFLLSHLHSDHLNVKKGFKYRIHTSKLAQGFIPDKYKHQVIPDLVPGTFYLSEKYKVPIYVFSTYHAPESIGFLFPTLGVFYVGDAPMGKDTLDMDFLLSHYKNCLNLPLQIIYDNVYEKETRFPIFPTRESSCAQIRKLLDFCPKVHFVHHGLLNFISLSCPVKFAVHESMGSELMKNAINVLDLLDNNSKYTLVGKSYQGDHIVVSSMWFIHRKQNPKLIYRDGHRWRIFCSMHASPDEVVQIKNEYPLLEFHPVTKKLVS